MQLISREQVNAARMAPIEDVWIRLNLPPSNGKIFRSPFREDKNPSCQLGGEKNIFFDHGTGEVLDTIALVQKVQNCNFGEAVVFIVTENPPSAEKDAIKKLALARNWKPEALRALGALSQKNEVYFPMRDSIGNTVGMRRRRADNQPFLCGSKALSIKGSKQGLICPYPLPKGPVLIVEGETDAAAAISAGWEAVIATPGAHLSGPCLRELQLLLARRDVILFPHPGTAGEKWLNQVGNGLANAHCAVHYVPAVDIDLDSQLQQAGGTRKYLEMLAKDCLKYEAKKLEVPQNVAEKLTLTDLGNAERLVKNYGDILRYNHERRRWLVWNNKAWEWDKSEKIVGLAKKTVRKIYQEAADEPDEKRRKALADHAKRSESDQRINALINLARSEPGIPIATDKLDAHHFLLNAYNGTINLKTGQLQPHRKEDLLSVLLPTEYHPEAQCPQWLKFLDTLTDGNRELEDYLQRAVGYSLTGVTTMQSLFFLYGLGNNGKTTFTMIFRKLLGGYAERLNAEDLMLQDKKVGGGPKEGIANLKNKRFVVSSELQDGRRFDVSLIKDMTGGETLKARRLYEHEIEFQPTHKLWLFGNHKPVITENTLAMWRRVKLIPFAVTIPACEIDPDLPAKLETELPGILAWAVKGCMDWQKYGLKEPEPVITATANYRIEQDILGDFLDDCCILEKAATALKSHMKDEYMRWCQKNDAEPVSQKKFRARLLEKGIEDHRLTTGRFWKGVKIKSII